MKDQKKTIILVDTTDAGSRFLDDLKIVSSELNVVFENVNRKFERAGLDLQKIANEISQSPMIAELKSILRDNYHFTDDPAVTEIKSFKKRTPLDNLSDSQRAKNGFR